MPESRKRLPRAQRRAQLLASATQVFAEQGYSAASMDDVAEAAGISKPVLYQHFVSKQALYLAVARQATEIVDEILRGALTSDGDRHSRILNTIRAFFRFADEHRHEYTVVFSMDAYEPEAQELYSSVRKGIVREVVQIITNGAEVERRSAAFLGGTVLAMGEAAAKFIVSDPTIDRDESARDFAAFIWNGINGLYEPVG